MASDDKPPYSEVQTLRTGNSNSSKPIIGDEICSFCGKGPDEINALVSKGSVRICDLCVNAARAGLVD